MGYSEKLKNKIEENFSEQMQTLKELVAIESVVSDPIDRKIGEGEKSVHMPFGEGVQQAFEYMLSKGEAFGFESENIENYGGHIEMGGYEYNEDGDMVGTNDEAMGIVCHLDTVPIGSDWTYDPLAGQEEDGKIYGRGTGDDKGPTVAALYAMKAIDDLGIKPSKKVRLILGLDEETNWEGMEKYNEEVEPPAFGFTPDGDFPAIHGEKGILVFDIAKKFGKGTDEGLALRSFKGGSAPNMVADSARAVVNSKKQKIYDEIKEKANQWREAGKMQINAKATGKSFEITVKGVSAHGAHPELGENAISNLMEFLGTLSFSNDDINDFIDFYNEHIGKQCDGKAIGCYMEDEESGHTVFNVGMIDLDTKSVRLTVNVRYPISCSDNQIYDGMDQVCRKYNLGIVKDKHEKPIFIPKDDSFIETLMEIYRKHTGDTDSDPLVIGGGTYARAFKNVVAFGARFPGNEDVAHQKNEYIEKEQFKLMTLIYADAIYRLTCE